MKEMDPCLLLLPGDPQILANYACLIDLLTL